MAWHLLRFLYLIPLRVPMLPQGPGFLWSYGRWPMRAVVRDLITLSLVIILPCCNVPDDPSTLTPDSQVIVTIDALYDGCGSPHLWLSPDVNEGGWVSRRSPLPPCSVSSSSSIVHVLFSYGGSPTALYCPCQIMTVANTPGYRNLVLVNAGIVNPRQCAIFDIGRSYTREIKSEEKTVAKRPRIQHFEGTLVTPEIGSYGVPRVRYLKL